MKFRFTFLALFIGFIAQAQVIAYQPDNLIVCDDNNDGFAVFDLTQTFDQIIDGQDPLDHYITFHLTQQDADSNINPIVNDINYTNISNPQTIYARLEHVASSEYDTTSFELIVAPKPEIGVGPFEIFLCDDWINGSTGVDGISTFDLTMLIDDITLGDSSLNVMFYESLADQNTGNSILNPSAYQNIVDPQSILVSVFNEFGCEIRTVITISVIPNPSPNPSPDDLVVCDDDNDGFAEFNLHDADANIINGEPNVSITYHDTSLNAEFDILPLSSPYNNNVFYNDVVFFRVENDITGCYTTGILELIVLDSPIIGVVGDYILIDNGNDGVEIFDLTTLSDLIVGGQVGMVLTYFETEMDAQNNQNPILDPMNYQNTSNPQTIFVRLESVNSCFSIGNFDLVLDPTAGINDEEVLTFSMVPNPASEIIQIQSSNFSSETNVLVYNIQGQVVYSEIKNSETDSFTINVSNLPTGMYFVQLQSEGNTVAKKLIKQ